MDEKGIAMGLGNKVKVLVPRLEAQAFITELGNRDWVFIIESISGSQYRLPPYFIFQGKQMQQFWISPRLNHKTVIQVSDLGWTNSDIAVNWLKHFNQYTEPRLQGSYRLLILDGHESHILI